MNTWFCYVARFVPCSLLPLCIRALYPHFAVRPLRAFHLAPPPPDPRVLPHNSWPGSLVAHPIASARSCPCLPAPFVPHFLPRIRHLSLLGSPLRPPAPCPDTPARCPAAPTLPAPAPDAPARCPRCSHPTARCPRPGARCSCPLSRPSPPAAPLLPPAALLPPPHCPLPTSRRLMLPPAVPPRPAHCLASPAAPAPLPAAHAPSPAAPGDCPAPPRLLPCRSRPHPDPRCSHSPPTIHARCTVLLPTCHPPFQLLLLLAPVRRSCGFACARCLALPVLDDCFYTDQR
ncbi:hypothetical protein B0H11DRAFT_2215345 [Mycena galericulata]|nr:hypothetical protein B0H11DRAFT_2215345 [Mycena galericulata]